MFVGNEQNVDQTKPKIVMVALREVVLSGSLAIRNSDFGPFFGRFSAKLGPKTPLERRGSSCSAGWTKNQPRRPILKPFRCNSEF